MYTLKLPIWTNLLNSQFSLFTLAQLSPLSRLEGRFQEEPGAGCSGLPSFEEEVP